MLTSVDVIPNGGLPQVIPDFSFFNVFQLGPSLSCGWIPGRFVKSNFLAFLDFQVTFNADMAC